MNNTEIMAMTIAEAVRTSGIGRTRLYELMASGEIAARKCGARTLILAASLREYLARLPAADIRTGLPNKAA